MIDQQVICPYTGLRSFSEEESLYFKGRDLQVDQITALLEQNKFLMVTGASGEGKSSLIYAGLIPNARAGFFKAKFTNWVVADFRPERTPLINMAEALAKTFGTKAASIETELRRGYSSLVDLYTNSEFYVDEMENQQISDSEKKEKTRKAANLIILIDQFEEFFTNPGNFYKEAPSQDAQIVVNLALETARIAIKKNLPVYVICTMRSDYIGQCSAFRGLPEYIGFSQFFVPRLKRKDLKQVIEEPAILSGNRISQRLVERLVFDIEDGIDQLPILQHALSQVWLAADHGRQEMDLIHYAMVGGMPAIELPDEDQRRFQHWYDDLSPLRQKYYQDTGLSKVIEIHASILYENAWENYNAKHPNEPISQKEAKRIIALTFSCLTKIDNSRAVRNRMSLGEITGIINSPGISSNTVNEVLSIYREEGNSFIRPFKTEDHATHDLAPETVLDITHESLIRNWNKLNNWAKREFEYYSTYLDFKKQLDRWKNSKKDRGFLLPIGPLTYFEDWYHKCNPNVGWITRYAESRDDQEKTKIEAESILEDIRKFIKRSARKVATTRAFIKYGPQRIAIIAAVVAMVLLSGFYWYDAAQKQNKQVIEKVRAEISKLMKSKEVGSRFKSFPILFQERYEPGYLMNYLNKLEPKERFSLGISVYDQLLYPDKHDKSERRAELTRLIQACFKELLNGTPDYPFLLPELNRFSTLLAYDQYYNPSDSTEKMLRSVADEGYRMALVFLKSKALFKATIPTELNYDLQQWLTFGTVEQEKVKTILGLFSPMEGGEAEAVFEIYYPKGSKEINRSTSISFNGGYHTIASLYAALGDSAKVRVCFEAIRQSGQNDYFTDNSYNNYINILGIFYQFGHRDKTGSLIGWLEHHYAANSPLAIYRNAVIRSGYINLHYRGNIYKYGFFHPNLCLASREVFNALADDYEKLISQVKDPSERNYLLAINEKRRAMYLHKYYCDRRLSADTVYLVKLLQQALDHFRKVSGDSLEKTVSVTLPYGHDGVRTGHYKRRDLFIYPDYMDGWYSEIYHSDLFFNFIDRNHLFEELYKSPEDLGLIQLWITRAVIINPNYYPTENNYPLNDGTLTRMLGLAKTHPQGKSLDNHWSWLLLANRAFARKDVVAGLEYYKQFDKEDFAASRDRYEYMEKTFFLNQLKDLCVYLALAGKHKEAIELAEKFEKDHEKAYAYIFMAENLYVQHGDPIAFDYLDSVFSKSRDVDFSQLNYNYSKDYRYNWILLLSRIGSRPLNSLSDGIQADILEGNKTNVMVYKETGLAEEGNFYNAWTAIPSTLTETEDLLARTFILWQACIKKETTVDREKWAAMDEVFQFNFYYVNYLVN